MIPKSEEKLQNSFEIRYENPARSQGNKARVVTVLNHHESYSKTKYGNAGPGNATLNPDRYPDYFYCDRYPDNLLRVNGVLSTILIRALY